MLFYQIDYVYFIFPFICLICLILNKGSLFLLFYLIFFLGFSKVGPDYISYKSIFDQIENKVILNSIHGEILFKKYMQLFINLRLDYETFRIFHICISLSFICYFLFKLSKNRYYSLFILYCGYILYICSAYRQFITMAFLFAGVYLVKKNKINYAILLNTIGIGFHISSILQIIFFVFFKIKSKIKINKILIYYIIIICLLFRFLVGYFRNYIELFLTLFGRGDHFRFYVQELPSLSLPFGLLTRLISLLFVLFYYKSKDSFEDKIFIMYVFSILLYVLFPFEAIMGRLTNNGRILECILFPSLINQQKNRINKIVIKNFIISYWILVLIAQLLRQGGYYPYVNLLF